MPIQGYRVCDCDHACDRVYDHGHDCDCNHGFLLFYDRGDGHDYDYC